jgi:hypothetical protein
MSAADASREHGTKSTLRIGDTRANMCSVPEFSFTITDHDRTDGGSWPVPGHLGQLADLSTADTSLPDGSPGSNARDASQTGSAKAPLFARGRQDARERDGVRSDLHDRSSPSCRPAARYSFGDHAVHDERTRRRDRLAVTEHCPAA